MSDVIEKLVDFSPVGLLMNAAGGDAGGGFAKMTGLKKDEAGGAPAAAATTSPTITGENSVEAQSAQRRLARLSRYFTTPTGVMDSETGSQGVF
jgi:hypothetical protein